MKIQIENKITKTDLLVLPFYAGKSPGKEQREALGQYGHPDFEGKPNESLMLYPKSKITPRVLLLGLGKQKEETRDRWRSAGGTLQKSLKRSIQSITILFPKEEADLIDAFIEGLQLAHYRYEDFVNDPTRTLAPLQSIRLIIKEKSTKTTLEKKIKKTTVITDAVKAVRDMVNAPSNAMSPSMMSRRAQKIARGNRHLKCQVFGEAKLKKMKMGCLLGVGQGAKEESKLIVLEYKNSPRNKKPVVLIGKGICFDAGGLNLKTRSLPLMKFDMTGAASVLGVFQILQALKPKLHVIGIAACAENLVGAGATKPGDVHVGYDGTTVEITNTDAEGRLVLSDAISYAVQKYKPAAIVDIATLTGAASVALGHRITALMSNQPALGVQLKEAAEAVDEKVWELPTEEEYKQYLKSPIADVCNFNRKPKAGTIMGGLFLEYFTKGTPWAHLDVGGSAWTDEDQPYYPKGATGRNVRTLWKFLENYAN